MRKFALALVAAAALAGAGMAISSGGPNAKLASQFRIYGGGVYGPCFDGDFHFCFAAERTFAVDVHVDGRDSGAAYGDWQNGVVGQYMYTGQVTCARSIGGGTTIIGGFLTGASGGANPAYVGLTFAQYITDNGGVESTTADQVSVAAFNVNDGAAGDFPTSFPATCPAQAFSDDVAPLINSDLRGDVVVQQ